MGNGTIKQTTEVSGSGNVAFTIGKAGQIGHVHVGDVQVVADSQFFDLKLEELRSEPSLEPLGAGRLVEVLAEERLLIVAGTLDDKGACARDLAFRLGQRLVGANGASVTVRERWRGKEPQRLESALTGEGPTILLMPEISKSQLAGYSPSKLRSLLQVRNGYAVITTDCSRKHWDIDEGGHQERVWHELSSDGYYGRAERAGFLKRLLVDSELPVPDGLLPDGPEGSLLIDLLPLVTATDALETPERIRFFAESLLDGSTPPSRQGIDSKLAELAGDAEAIRQWYEEFEPRDQLLAVGLVLLDGLPDDLLFAGLELLVESTWRGTDPLLAQFDYRDLTRFAAYFKETRVEGGFVRIESGSRLRRRQILEAAWRHQRRRLLATLPALTEMIRVSASESLAPPREVGAAKPQAVEPPAAETATVGRSAARALGRTERGSMQLHQVLVETLSLIGLLSIEVVEPYLLDLAADPSESVQHLVAAALAAWRDEDGKDDALFSLLRGWWAEACNVGDSSSRVARAARLGPDPWAAVRAAVALAVGYAVQYDKEDRLAPALHALLAQLLVDPHPRVRGIVARFTLPRALTWHFRELESLTRTRALAVTDYIVAVARGAAAACELRPEACLPILDSWRTIARGEARRGAKDVANKEILLATVALTWGYIRCDDEQPRLSAAAVTSKLRALVTEETHPFVRHHAFFAIEIQTQRDFALAAQLLQALLSRVSLADRPSMVELAVRTYLHQRQQLEGGDRRIELGGRSYPVWTASVRPLTGLEASLYGWILDDTRPVAQQLAVDIFAALSDTSLDVEERRLQAEAAAGAADRLAGSRPESGTAVRRVGPDAPQTRGLGPLGHLAVFLAAPRKQELRRILGPILAEVIFESRPRRAMPGQATPPGSGPAPAAAAVVTTTGDQRIEALLARWTGVRNAATNAIAGYLRRSLTFYRWRWALVLAAAMLLSGGYTLGKKGWDAWNRHRAAAAPLTAPAPALPAGAALDATGAPAARR